MDDHHANLRVHQLVPALAPQDKSANLEGGGKGHKRSLTMVALLLVVEGWEGRVKSGREGGLCGRLAKKSLSYDWQERMGGC